MSSKLTSARAVFATAICALLGVMRAGADDVIGYNVSPQVKVKDGERVVGLTITLTNGTFASFNGIPEGWYFRIDNSTHRQEALSGEVSVGAGALYRKELSDFWICVHPKSLAGEKFELSGELLVTTDFEKTRKVRLVQSNFVTHDCKAPTKKSDNRHR